jgi:putative transposase
MSASCLVLHSPASLPMPISSAPRPTPQWMSKEAIAERTGISERSIERYAAQGKTISRELPSRGRNGKPAREFLVLSLPEELRQKLHAAQQPAIVPAPPVSGPLFHEPAPRGERIMPADDKADAQARERYQAIEPLINFDHGKYRALRLSDGRAITTADRMAEYIAQTVKIDGKRPSKRTLWRWVGQFRSGSLTGLARKTREDQGQSRFFTRYSAAAVLVAAEFHKPYATYSRAYNALERDRELLQIPAEEMPSYTTVRKFLDSLPAPMRILAREGQRAYSERCAPHLNRAYTDIPVNQTWVADHQIHDVEVRNDCMTGAPIDAPIRLQFTCLMDLRSRKIVGYCWTVNGDWRSIATALRRACERYGPCEVFYCDNGEDFKKAAKGAPRIKRPSREEIEAAANELARTGPVQQLGMAVQFCIPYAPQGKPVERLFGTVHKGLDAIMPHYTTGNAYTRPDQTILAGAEHRKLLKMGMGSASSLMPASLFIKLAETWIEQKYNAGHHHRGRGMDGRTPDEVFDEGYPVAQRRTADPDALAMLLHERRSCYVRRTAVTIDGNRYMPLQSSQESWIAIHSANETHITVAYDPLDPNVAIALDARGRRMATLQAERLVEHPGLEGGTRENNTQIANMAQTKGRLLKATVGTVKQIHRTVALAGHKSDLEHLAELAQVQQPVDDLVSQRAVRAAAASDFKTTHSEDNAARYFERMGVNNNDGAL